MELKFNKTNQENLMMNQSLTVPQLQQEQEQEQEQEQKLEELLTLEGLKQELYLSVGPAMNA